MIGRNSYIDVDRYYKKNEKLTQHSVKLYFVYFKKYALPKGHHTSCGTLSKDNILLIVALDIPSNSANLF